ncbi:HAD-IA family hydrolase [Neomegalonema sp.]|uniref:HAD-IA family hydrolase n=1 Tax=Neomegalonema sp. TaxID=2039713 RepID=UPI002625223E|nr:HAD-IA family hydrolase [Neomegalonema sp.]MDD2868092.1 HAD-IA family hydrolase [Neomegalonema sp.]
MSRSAAPLKLAIFDFDGTLVDSGAVIVSNMQEAFRRAGLEPPAPAACLRVVGLSLADAVAAIEPHPPAHLVETIVEHYRARFQERRKTGEADTGLFPGAFAVLERLKAQGATIAAATGNSRRGLESVLDVHGLRPLFSASQTADDAPSKPDPGMILNLLAETGFAAEEAVMIGDTVFDIAMAKAVAGCKAVGVAWGHHAEGELRAAGADAVIRDFSELDRVLEGLFAAGGAS